MAVVHYLRHLIRNNALTYVRSQFSALRAMATESLAKAMEQSLRENGVLTRSFYGAFKKSVLTTVSQSNLSSYTGAYVRWYIWATDAGFDEFDPEVACEFESLTIGGNPTGQAVLSHDVNDGPLRDVEMTQLRSALRAAQTDKSIDLADLTLAWIMIALGTNARNIILLEEKDYIRTELEDGQVIHELRVPRIKKRTAGLRDQFRTRGLVPEIGELIAQLIEQNQSADHVVGAIRPLFRSAKPRPSLIGTLFQDRCFRKHPRAVHDRLKILSKRLGLVNVEGGPLRLYPRRLRYSFATRLVQEGASVQDVADALDHTSTDHVMVYFNARSDAVRNLDRALSTILAPIAQAFLGMVINSEADATRGDDPTSRITHMDTATKKREGLGNCGEFGFCSLAAPVACYTCTKFQAWLSFSPGWLPAACWTSVWPCRVTRSRASPL